MENDLQIGMGLIELTKSCLKMLICLSSWTVSSSQWLSTVSILKSIFPACGMADTEQPMIHIRLYREGGQYVELTNNKKKKKEKGEKEYKKRKRGKRIQKRKKKEKKKKRRHMYNSR
jgi:hypothetical protein